MTLQNNARHLPTLEYDGHGNMNKCVPTCACGWKGKPTTDHKAALRACAEHKIAADLGRTA